MFHLQQMLAKLLKALILATGNAFERTHDLDRLAHAANVQNLEGLADLSDTLNVFSVNGRYPGDLPEIDIPTARRFFDEANKVRESILQRVIDAPGG